MGHLSLTRKNIKKQLLLNEILVDPGQEPNTHTAARSFHSPVGLGRNRKKARQMDWYNDSSWLLGKTNAINPIISPFHSPQVSTAKHCVLWQEILLPTAEDTCPGYVLFQPLAQLQLTCWGWGQEREIKSWHFASTVQQQPKCWCYQQRFNHKCKTWWGNLTPCITCLLWADGLCLTWCYPECLFHRWTDVLNLPCVNSSYLQRNQQVYCG